MRSLLIAAAAFLVSYASAECNNMCSGHGTCGANDACTCYRNWRGNDCSERTCQYGNAFVDTAQGDLNHDGVVSSAVSVTTQWAKSGTWELYPNSAVDDDAHFYMECSNKGLCDRSSGECVCFDGYEGSACQRTVCPNKCSGNGVCRNIVDLQQSLPGKAASQYQLWDGLKNQACVCDYGYQGIDCSERRCPHNADPLIDGKIYETQKLTITTLPASGADAFYLTYTDITFGETFRTSAIKYNTDLDVFENNILSALIGIPNGVIPLGTDKVTKVDCSGTGPVICYVAFNNNAGDLQPLGYYALHSGLTIAVAELDSASAVSKGTNTNEECSGRGLCNYETGMCKCFRGYRYEDCRAQHALAFNQ